MLGDEISQERCQLYQEIRTLSYESVLFDSAAIQQLVASGNHPLVKALGGPFGKCFGFIFNPTDEYVDPVWAKVPAEAAQEKQGKSAHIAYSLFHVSFISTVVFYYARLLFSIPWY